MAPQFGRRALLRLAETRRDLHGAMRDQKADPQAGRDPKENSSSPAPVDGARSAGSTSAVLGRDLAMAAAAAGGDGAPLHGALVEGDLGARRRALATAQRAAGNAAVQQLLAGVRPAGERAPALQRQAGGWGGGTKHTFKGPFPPVRINKRFGPVKLSEATFGGEATLDMQEGAGAQAGAPTQVRVGGVGGPGTSGLQAEVERAVGDQLTIWGQEFQPKVKLGGEKTNKSGEIGVEGSLEGQFVSTSVKFVIVGRDYEKGSLEIATLKWKVIELKKEIPFQALGKARKLELKGNVELSFEPDWARIGSWLLEQLASEAAIEGAILFGFLAGGAAVVGLYVYTIMTAGEIAERVDAAASSLRGATRAYKAVMTGAESPGGQGADIGSREAQKALAQSRVPLPSVYEENKKKDLSQEAYKVLAPEVRKAAIDDYWKEHWFERWVYGAEGVGSGGFRTFKRVLDAAIPPP